MRVLNALYVLSIIIISCTNAPNVKGTGNESIDTKESILKIEMNLSAFGVEADHIPNITAIVDFDKGTSFCDKSFYNPAYQDSSYELTSVEMSVILALLESADLKKLKTHYSIDITDQLSAKTVIFTTESNYTINDYGLVADEPLQTLYDVVYKY